MASSWIIWVVGAVVAAAAGFISAVGRRAYFYHLVPEHRILPEEKEQRELYRYIQRHVEAQRSWSLAIRVAFFVVLFAFILFTPLSVMSAPVFATAAVTADLLLTLGRWFLLRGDVQTTARRRIVELGFPLCVYCGYDLRAATGKICPECGNGPYPGVFRKSADKASGAA